MAERGRSHAFLPTGNVRSRHVHHPSDSNFSFLFNSAYAAPDVFNGTVSISVIPDGTYINETHLSLTYLCNGCITGDDLTFNADDETAVLGWALSAENPEDVTDAGTALVYHSAGFGNFGAALPDAKNKDYDTWAAMVEEPAEPTATPTSAPTSTDASGSTSTSATV